MDFIMSFNLTEGNFFVVGHLFLEKPEKTKLETDQKVDVKANAIFGVENFVLELSKPVVCIYKFLN